MILFLNFRIGARAFGVKIDFSKLPVLFAMLLKDCVTVTFNNQTSRFRI